MTVAAVLPAGAEEWAEHLHRLVQHMSDEQALLRIGQILRSELDLSPERMDQVVGQVFRRRSCPVPEEMLHELATATAGKWDYEAELIIADAVRHLHLIPQQLTEVSNRVRAIRAGT